jgi:hypothetical protein
MKKARRMAGLALCFWLKFIRRVKRGAQGWAVIKLVLAVETKCRVLYSAQDDGEEQTTPKARATVSASAISKR